MRVIYLLRGSPGSGKSTWIEQNYLKEFTLCADDIRLLIQSPIMLSDGTYGISQKNDNKVWKILFSLLEERMLRGELIFVDATHSKSSDFSKYKKLIEKYRYRAYCIDFSDIPIEVSKQRNNDRFPYYKKVPESVIDNMYARFESQKPPNYAKIIKPEEFRENFQYKPRDLSNYQKIVLFGDIHGCYSPLKQYFDQNPLSDENFYIFLGDYIDRGVEDDKVIEFLLDIYNKENIVLLEGNHDLYIYLYSTDREDEIKSSEFKNNTKPKLERFAKKDLRNLCRRFAQICFFTYHDNYFLASHGGISNFPDNLLEVATDQFIRGVGAYEDYSKCADNFLNLTPKNHYSISGHRNVGGVPLMYNERCFNLCEQVEFGGNLRILEIYND